MKKFIQAFLVVLFALLYETNASPICGSGEKACGNACFDPNKYKCFSGDILCPVTQDACVKICFDPKLYHCDNGKLVSGAASTKSTVKTATVTSTTKTTTTHGTFETCTTSAPPKGYKFCRKFKDDFNKFDLKTWKHDVTLTGGGNYEFEWYTNNRTNSFVRDGILHIKPSLTSDHIGDKQVMSGGQLDLWTDCTNNFQYGCFRASNGANILNPIKSASIRTIDSVTIGYGRVEVKAKLPIGDWLWPAIWMMPKYNTWGDWPASGEIDIMESRGNPPSYSQGGTNQIGSTLHFGPGYPFDGFLKTHKTFTLPNGATFSDDFHTFGVEWTPTYIKTYVDSPENVVLNVPLGKRDFWTLGGFSGVDNPWSGQCPQAPFDQEFYLIINLAVGGISGFFPDGVGNKPWKDSSPTAARDFWSAKSQWYPTWKKANQDSFQIDSVEIWDIC